MISYNFLFTLIFLIFQVLFLNIIITFYLFIRTDGYDVVYPWLTLDTRTYKIEKKKKTSIFKEGRCVLWNYTFVRFVSSNFYFWLKVRLPVYFYILKIFLKKFNFFLFFY